MLQFVVGRAGTGKTTHLWQTIRARAQAGGRSLLLVPEQFASTADLAGYLWLGDALHTRLKVCSFRTLTGRIENRYGGGALRSISDAGRMVLVRRVLARLGDEIVCFHRSRHSARFCADCADTLQQLKNDGVSPELLEAAAEEVGGSHGQRLRELGVIYRAYEEARQATGLEAADRLERAAARVEADFFAGTACFVDGFSEFNAPETALLRCMLLYAERLCVTLTCPDADFAAHRLTVFAPAADTGARLRRLARAAAIPEAPPLLLDQNRRFQAAGLLEVERRLAGQAAPLVGEVPTAVPPTPPTADTAPPPADLLCHQGPRAGLCCYAADGVYDEAQFVAAQAATLARAGVPFQQMAVLCRDPASYLPALTYACRLYDIPLFTGSTVSAEYAPMAVFLRAALGLGKNGLTSDGVLALLKTGLCGAGEAALSALENYVYTWRPKAADWRSPFTQNPAGMDAGEPGEAELATLALAEGLRARILPPIEAFRQNHGKTGRQISAALYQLLLDVGADGEVERRIAAESAQGLGGFDSARMWKTVIGFLDEMADLLGEEEVTPAEYDDLLCVLLRTAEIGQAPHTQNQLQLAAADRARLDDPAYVFVMGLNEGCFPAPVREDPLLSNDDRARLSRLGAPLSGDVEGLVLREQQHFYRALTAARRGLFLSWLGKKNGAALVPCSPLQALLDAMGLSPAAPTLAQLALTPAAALELLARRCRDDTPETAALRQVLRQQPETRARLLALEQAGQNSGFALRDAAALRRLLGESLDISPSRMESYYECPFGYFLQYILRVRPRPRAELGIPQSGTLVHWLLENLLRDFPALEGLDDEALAAELHSRLAAYTAQRLPGQDSRRLAYLVQRIGDNTLQLLRYLRDELAQSSFRPCAFEQDIGHEGGVPALELTAADGQRVRVVGTVDRVDTMTADGVTWLRVVDYKTGSKSFSLDDVCQGLNTQMLLYLFTLARNGQAQFGDVRPAGVLYLLSDPPATSDEAKSDFQVDGLVLDDPTVLAGMDRQLTGRYLPVKPDATRQVRAEKLVDLATLGAIAHRLEALVLQMAEALYAGQIPARPLRHDRAVRCTVCDYRPICRHRDGENEAEVPKGSWRALTQTT